MSVSVDTSREGALLSHDVRDKLKEALLYYNIESPPFWFSMFNMTTRVLEAPRYPESNLRIYQDNGSLLAGKS
jgi:hypothetical protein